MRPILLATFMLALTSAAFATPQFAVKYAGRLPGAAPDGRLFLILSNDPSEEPRMQVNDSAKTQQLFGIDVERWSPATPRVIDARVLGYPRDSLRDVPAGTYRVQAVFHRYEAFRRDGHTIRLPMDRGEGQQWNRAPGLPLPSQPVGGKFEAMLVEQAISRTRGHESYSSRGT